MTQIPPLPPGLKGQIVAVDPKYSFVILNMGEDKKLLVNGIMLVARDGKLIAKVQIARVDKTQSVANILPAWRRSDVMEGDEVID
jgi:negative regulator of sigma E activity